MEDWEIQPYILGPRGEHLMLLNPSESPILIDSIARSLSRLPRFTSHTLNWLPYNIGQHSLGVSYLVPPEYALEGLLHDATEYVLNDMSSPLKRLCPDYRAIEANWDLAIRQRFGLPAAHSPCIKQADLVMLATEKRDLMPYDTVRWRILDGILPMKKRIRPHISWLWTRHLFMKRFLELTK
jgi:hypothetical protein